jgi:hypothetical protein
VNFDEYIIKLAHTDRDTSRSLRRAWTIYSAVDEMVAAGVDFDAAYEAASTKWCDGRCGCSWSDDKGPMILHEDWRRIAKPGEKLLCTQYIEQRMGGPNAVQQSHSAFQEIFDRWLERRGKRQRPGTEYPYRRRDGFTPTNEPADVARS